MLLATASLIPARAQPQPADPARMGEPAAFDSVAGAIWISTADSHYRNNLNIDRFVEDVRRLPFGDILVHVRIGGQAFYESELVPKALGIPETLDPLDYLIRNIQEAGNQRIIAWISPYHAGHEHDAAKLEPRHVRRSHPDWLSQRFNGDQVGSDGSLYLEPGLPEVQAHIEAVIKDLVSRYDVAGLYIDPMHDPDAEWGYHPRVIERWQRENNRKDLPSPLDPTWIALRARILTEALGGFAGAAKAARPDLRVSVGGLAYGLAPEDPAMFTQSIVYRQYHQNWAQWLSMGIVDDFYLKNFKVEASSARDFDRWLELAKMLATPRTDIVCGVAGRFNESIDALRQMQRAAEAGVLRLALADYQAPVRDRGTRDLFMTAIGLTVLSPEYMQRMVNLRESSVVRQAEAEAAVAELEAARQQAEQALSTPVQRQPEPADFSELPPPPSLDEASIPDNRVVLTPVIRDGPEPAAGTEEDLREETRVALDALSDLMNGEPLGTNADEAGTTRPAEESETSLLDELIDDPRLESDVMPVKIDVHAQSRDYLRRRFPNIFN